MKITFKPEFRIVAMVPAVHSIERLCETLRTISTPLFEGLRGHTSDEALRAIVAQGAGVAPDGLLDVLDTRLHRLMPGQFPAIPGWHCDDVPRRTYESQPCFELIDHRVKHWTVTLASDPCGVSCTEFVAEEVTIDIDDSRPTWRQVHDFVEREKPRTYSLPPGSVCEFKTLAIHRATPATMRGWRWWSRVSWRANRPSNIVNTAEQVYILSEANGW